MRSAFAEHVAITPGPRPALQIRTFFADFLRLFFPSRASRFDLSSVERLQTEILSESAGRDRDQLDMVARLRTTQASVGAGAEHVLALVHFEIESPDSQVITFICGNAPVLPIMLYLESGLEGIGVDAYEERFRELTVLTFRFLYVGLPTRRS